MLPTLLFATHNPHKAEEIKKFIPKEFKIKSLSDIDWTAPIEETGHTLEENAWIKVQALIDFGKENCFADDSGLEIEALGGQPGVYSARFAGATVNANENMDKVLRLMEGVSNRKAIFRTVIVLYWQGQKFLFEGCVHGTIIDEKRGVGGFGYDPIFVPEGYEKTFAELTPEIKNKIGHRGKALLKMVSHLKLLR